MSFFGDRLTAAVVERESQLVLGLDPPLVPDGEVTPWCRALIDAAGPHCVAAKLQLACFERLGPPGWGALYEVASRAADAGLLVIADGKRGDVPVSSTAYAEALVRRPFDALTVNPALGGDAIGPLLDAATSSERGLFALVRTSNPGAAELQDVELGDGRPWHMALAELVAEWGSTSVGASGLSALGAVVGATVPERARSIRAAMPEQPLLMPGVGPQGGHIDDLVGLFGGHPAGVLVPVSRGISQSDDPGEAAATMQTALWRVFERELSEEPNP